jgi:hypothetical protein
MFHLTLHVVWSRAIKEPFHTGKYAVSSRIVGVALTPPGKAIWQCTEVELILDEEIWLLEDAQRLLFVFPPHPFQGDSSASAVTKSPKTHICKALTKL